MPAAQAIPLGFVAGLVSALFLLLTETGNPGAMILGGMSLLPVFMAGFGAGNRALVSALVIGLGVTAWLGGKWYGLVFVEQIAIPSLLLVPLALARPAPPSAARLVLGVTGLGCAAFALVFMLMRQQEGGLLPHLEAQMLAVLTRLQSESDVQLPEPAALLASRISFWALGATVAVWMLTIVGNGLLAQGALSRFDRTLRATPAMESLDLPYALSLLFALSVAAWWFGRGEIAYVGANVAEILSVPLLLGGLAVVHALIGAAVHRPPARLVMLMAIYLIAFVSLWPIALIVVLGIAEEWIGLRRRLAGGPQRGD